MSEAMLNVPSVERAATSSDQTSEESQLFTLLLEMRASVAEMSSDLLDAEIWLRQLAGATDNTAQALVADVKTVLPMLGEQLERLGLLTDLYGAFRT